MSFEPLSGAVLSRTADIDHALASGGLDRPPGVPLELWLATLTEELPPPFPSGRPDGQPAAPEVNMARELINPCSKPGCSNRISAQNKSGVCTPCQQGRTAHLAGAPSKKATAPKKKRRTADDALVDRLLGGAKEVAKKAADEAVAEQEKKAAAHAAVEKDESWLAKFYRLHEALGLDAEGAIEEHCRAWVEATTARALGDGEAPTLRDFKKKARVSRAPKPNGATKPLENIGDDYEKASEQAQGAPA